MPFPQLDYRDDIVSLINAVRLSKKADVDIVLLNEIPNKEVFFAVRDCVNSSMLVATTLHMNRLWHLPHKLFEYAGDGFRDVLSQIRGVSNQRMYASQCGECLEVVSVDSLGDQRLIDWLRKHDVSAIRKASGCEKCGGTGVLRTKPVVLTEFLMFSNELVLELFEAEKPYLMERVLYQKLIGTTQCLEFQMLRLVESGRLSVNSIYSIM
jgi:type II secretory ATPase GspE/PulE/Tfp pilus assembly ATPase PilB-like protein